MGNDGGSIPKRRELVKEAARLPSASELKATALESLAHAWDTCPLSSEPLDPVAGTTVVSDWRGRLYSYESVLQCLTSTTTATTSSDTPSSTATPIPATQQAEFARTGIRGLRDVVKLQFAVRRDERGRGVRACPVSMKELGAGSNARAVYVVPCGHVFAEVAIRETIGTTAANSDDNKGKSETKGKEDKDTRQKQCPECSEPFQERDLIPILSTDEAELEKLARRVDELKALGLTHSLKKDKSSSGNGSGGGGGKSKNKKKRKAGGEDASEEKEEAKANNSKDKTASKSRSDNKNGISSRINNSATASLTAKVLAEQEERNKRRKMTARSEAVR
ncbi:Replication termination factor 2 [Diatrype stigma]|uniref:Replication termination factor 2 n=1 Tax=Diatrype stigma TaxID=117547 RepID=A0AAN9UHW8_9PEZI